MNQSEESINKLCEKIIFEIAALKEEHKASKVKDVITVSIGAYTKMIDTADEMLYCINHADEVLYQVKRNGRNGYDHLDVSYASSRA